MAIDYYDEEQTNTRFERLMPLLVFVGAFALMSLWAFPILHPSVWEECAIASGLRPPLEPFPGQYRAIVRALFALLPADSVLTVLPYIGRAMVALCAAGLYSILRGAMPAALRMRRHMEKLGTLVARLTGVSGAVLFVCADPIWRAGQTFSPVTLFTGMMMLALWLFSRFLRRGSVMALYLCFALLGLLSGDNALGFVLSLFALGGVFAAAIWAANPDVPLVNPLVDDLVRIITFRRISFAWTISFVLAIGFNVWRFRADGGFEAAECSGVPELLFVYFRDAYEAVCSAARFPGWFFAVAMTVVPLFFAAKLLPKAWDDDTFLPYSTGVVYAIILAAALSQLGSVKAMWFWKWMPNVSLVSSDSLLVFFLLIAITAAAFAFAVFGVDACCRNYWRIAVQRFPESMQFQLPAKTAESLGRGRAWRKKAFWTAVVLVPIWSIPGRYLPLERGMMEVMDGYVNEVLEETRACDSVFTDGSFDALYELRAKARGASLHALSLMAPNNARERMVRLRSAENDEDRALFENSSAPALRTWVETGSPRLKKIATQLGFEMWRKGKKAFPPLSYVAAIPRGFTPEEGERAKEASNLLIEKIYALSKMAGYGNPSDHEIKRLFPFVVWRFSRLALARSKAADEAGQRDVAFSEAAVSDELDQVNWSLAKLRRDTAWHTKQSVGVLSPREGLVIGLARADFALAGRYAGPILRTDPDDPRANFAMGMMFLNEEQYARSEMHLKRCLVRRPKEPAVLNNLAVVQMRQGRLDEAEKNAEAAVAVLPDNAEIRKTLERVRKLKARK